MPPRSITQLWRASEIRWLALSSPCSHSATTSSGGQQPCFTDARWNERLHDCLSASRARQAHALRACLRRSPPRRDHGEFASRRQIDGSSRCYLTSRSDVLPDAIRCQDNSPAAAHQHRLLRHCAACAGFSQALFQEKTRAVHIGARGLDCRQVYTSVCTAPTLTSQCVRALSLAIKFRPSHGQQHRGV